MKKVVWLASWYPTEEHPLPGDFIERHAKAVSIYLPVHVIHVARIHDKNSRSGVYIKEYERYPLLKSEICPYRLPRFLGIDLLISYCWSLVLYARLVKAFIRTNGKPSLLHVHVTLRCGLVALYFKWFYRIPFVVSEHNGALLEAAKQFDGRIGFTTLQLMKLVIKNAAAITTVSAVLRNGIAKRFAVKRSFVIPNVVDTSIFNFRPGSAANNAGDFLHVSTLSAIKNVDLILRAFALVKQEHGLSFCFRIVGPRNDSLKRLAEELGIADSVLWLAETDQDGIAAEMRTAGAVILYSSYESFGCINIEANATGRPVIVSDIPAFREYLKAAVNAVFVPLGDVVALSNVLAGFIEGRYHFDPGVISDAATDFSFAAVGKMFAGLYDSIEAKI